MAEGGTLDVNLDTLPSEAWRLIKGYPNLQYQLQEYISSGRKHMTILFCGKTGVGKSHLTNALIGKVLAKEGETLDPETVEVSSYHVTHRFRHCSLCWMKDIACLSLIQPLFAHY